MTDVICTAALHGLCIAACLSVCLSVCHISQSCRQPSEVGDVVCMHYARLQDNAIVVIANDIGTVQQQVNRRKNATDRE